MPVVRAARSALPAALLLALGLVLPAAAQAAATLSVGGSTLTFTTSDGLDHQTQPYLATNGHLRIGDPGGIALGASGCTSVSAGVVDCGAPSAFTRLVFSFGAGDDTLSVGDGLHLPVTVDAGAGDDDIDAGDQGDALDGGDGADTVYGNGGADVVRGGPGDDEIAGGPGVDRFYGEDVDACIPSSCASGQDLIEARDGNQEMIDCGPGTDSAVVDPNELVRNDVDLSNQCESVDGLAASSSSGTGSLTASAKVSGGRIVVKLTAPSAGTASVKATAGRLKVGSATRQVAKAGAVTLRIKPSRAAARKHRLKVKLKIGFNAQTVTRTVTLRHG
jgi:hypothetical protein